MHIISIIYLLNVSNLMFYTQIIEITLKQLWYIALYFGDM